MARTQGLSVLESDSSCASVVPARIETSSVSGRSPASRSAAIARPACAGLTQSTMTPASGTRAATFVSTGMPSAWAAVSQVCVDRAVPHACSRCSAPASKRPLRIVCPITPVPTTPNVRPRFKSGGLPGSRVTFAVMVIANRIPPPRVALRRDGPFARRGNSSRRLRSCRRHYEVACGNGPSLSG